MRSSTSPPPPPGLRLSEVAAWEHLRAHDDGVLALNDDGSRDGMYDFDLQSGAVAGAVEVVSLADPDEVSRVEAFAKHFPEPIEAPEVTREWLVVLADNSRNFKKLRRQLPNMMKRLELAGIDRFEDRDAYAHRELFDLRAAGIMMASSIPALRSPPIINASIGSGWACGGPDPAAGELEGLLADDGMADVRRKLLASGARRRVCFCVATLHRGSIWRALEWGLPECAIELPHEITELWVADTERGWRYAEETGWNAFETPI